MIETARVQSGQDQSARIARLRERYHDESPLISVQRARYYTESWRATEGSGLPVIVRVAMAQRNVFEKMDIYVDDDDRIAGYWTESFLGAPIDIERGVYNTVLETELDRFSMVKFRVKSMAGMASYLATRRKVLEAVRSARAAKAAGPMPMNLGFDTMTTRSVNRYRIEPGDKAELRRELLPYWRGRTLVDRLEREIDASGLLGRNMSDFARSLPANTSRQTAMISTCATIATYQGHVIIDYQKALEYGLDALLESVRRDRAGTPGLTDDEAAFLDAAASGLEGLIAYADRLAEAVARKAASVPDPDLAAEFEKLAAVCRRVPRRPARSFLEAVQSAWCVKTALEIAHPMNLNCFGRMDQVFNPYYERDLAAGAVTREQALEVIEELLLKVMSQNIRLESNILSNFYHRYLGSSPITVGGLTRQGDDAANEMTLLFIEASARARAVTNLSIRVHENTADQLFDALALSLHDGCSNISVFNDDVNVEAMIRRGFSEEDARDYAVMGCVELLCPGKTAGMSANALLLCRLLDMTLRNGDSKTLMGTIDNVGLQTGGPESFETFGQLIDAFHAQAAHQVGLLAEASLIRDRLFADELPAPLLSPFIDHCLERRRDFTRGGADYELSGISFINSIGNLVDSLYVIRKLVYEEKLIGLPEFIEAVDRNFEGFEELHARIAALDGKWGNGCAEVDALAREITTRLFEETYKRRGFRGGPFVPYIISMITHTIDGRVSIATPDGRRAAMPFAASCNPYNVEKNGVTAAMRSIAALDYRHVLGCAVNMKFHPTMIGRDQASRRKWIALLRTYFKLGGAQLQPTVVSADTLRRAREAPDEFKDLVVKVGGYSAYFTELGREIQAEVIARTEHAEANR